MWWNVLPKAERQHGLHSDGKDSAQKLMSYAMKKYEKKLVMVHQRLSGPAIKKLKDWTSEC